MPLHAAFPLTRGIGVLGVQLAASMLVFHEQLRPTEIAGAAVVTAGMILVGLGSRTGSTGAPTGASNPRGTRS